MKTSYAIVKVLKIKNGKPQHVLLVDSGGEILEFDDMVQAENIAKLFESNSEKGYKYFVKQI
jgi:hypothetical protein